MRDKFGGAFITLQLGLGAEDNNRARRAIARSDAGQELNKEIFPGLVPVFHLGPDLGPDLGPLGIGAKENVATNLAKSLHLTRPTRLNIIGVIVCGGQIAALLTGQDRLGHGLALLPEGGLNRTGLAIALAGKAELATRARRALEHDLTDCIGPADLAGAIKHDLGHGHLARTRLAPRLIIYGLGQAFQIAGTGTNGTAAKTHALGPRRGQLAIAILYGAVLVQPRRKQV